MNKTCVHRYFSTICAAPDSTGWVSTLEDTYLTKTVTKGKGSLSGSSRTV